MGFVRKTRIPILRPSAFLFTPPFAVYRDVRTGTVSTTFDAAKFAPNNGATYYIHATTGVDTNPGTEAQPFKSIAKALSMPDVGTVMVAAGFYSRSIGTFPTSPTRSVSIKAYGGTVTFSASDGLVWSATAGQANTYQATRSSVLSVYDKTYSDVHGDYQRYTQRASIADVTANAGSWYTDGTTLYVRTSDSRAPDSNIRAYLNVKNAYIAGNITVYLEGISFEGGNYALQVLGTTGAVPTVYAKDCAFKYANSANSVTVQGANTFFQRCVAAQSYNDGFNYHTLNGVGCRSVEIDCVGRNNGYAGGDNNNGSTTHDGNAIIRIGGRYFGNNGPNVVDVNSSQSWNVDCLAFNSKGAAAQNVNYHIDGTMWLDSCVSLDSTVDLRVQPGTMYTRNTKTLGVNSIQSGSTLAVY